MNANKLSRREFMYAATIAAAGAALSACQRQAITGEDTVPETIDVDPDSKQKGDPEMVTATIAANAIPKETAARLCGEICEENRGKWYTFNGLWCLGCASFTPKDGSQRCWAATPDCRGCSQVNARYDRQLEGA